MDGITKESYEKMPVQNKLDVLYDGQVELKAESGEIKKMLIGQRLKIAAYSSMGGVVGGFLAVLAKGFFTS